MAALGAHGFPVPRAVEHNRHAVLMSLVDAALLVQARAPRVDSARERGVSGRPCWIYAGGGPVHEPVCVPAASVCHHPVASCSLSAAWAARVRRAREMTELCTKHGCGLLASMFRVTLTTGRGGGLRCPSDVPVRELRPSRVARLRDTLTLSAAQVRELRNPGAVYAQLMDLLARLAAKGLIHCDFNEFNLLVRAARARGQPRREPCLRRG